MHTETVAQPTTTAIKAVVKAIAEGRERMSAVDGPSSAEADFLDAEIAHLEALSARRR